MDVVSSRLGAKAPAVAASPNEGLVASFTWNTSDLEIAVHGLTGAVNQPVAMTDLCARASAIVFVADSQESRLEANEWRIVELYERIGRTRPVVLQFNKRDLVPQSSLTPVAELSRKLNRFDAREYETVAPKGIGVWDAFVAAVTIGARAQGIESVAAAALADRRT